MQPRNSLSSPRACEVQPFAQGTGVPTQRGRGAGHCRRARLEQGLTLIEIMIVIVLLGLLYTFLIQPILSGGDRSKARITEMALKRIEAQIGIFRLQYNQLPNSLTALAQCNEQTGQGCVPLISADELKDAWGRPFVYQSDGTAYMIKSLGADGREGGEGVNYDVFVRGP